MRTFIASEAAPAVVEGGPAGQAKRLKHAQVIAALVVGRRQQLVAVEDAVGTRQEAQRLRDVYALLGPAMAVQTALAARRGDTGQVHM